MKLCSLTQSTHSHSPPTRLLMLREKLSTCGFFVLCTYSFTFFSPPAPLRPLQRGGGSANLREVPPAILANPKPFRRENPWQHSCVFKIVILHYIRYYLKYPTVTDFFKKLRDRLIAVFWVHNRMEFIVNYALYDFDGLLWNNSALIFQSPHLHGGSSPRIPQVCAVWC